MNNVWFVLHILQASQSKYFIKLILWECSKKLSHSVYKPVLVPLN